MRLTRDIKKDIRQYVSKRLEGGGKKVEITSAYELSPEEIALLKGTFTVLQNAEIQTNIDSSILGGVIIRYDSKIIDLSLKTELENLKQTLYART